MQHFGLPTRLLDWTASSFFGLFFALSRGSQTDSAVWILDPWKLDEYVIGKHELMYVYEAEINAYLPSVYSGQAIPEHPAAIVPRYISSRIISQRSCFTVYGSDEQPLETFCASKNDSPLTNLEIPKKSIGSIRKELQVAGITETSVFPDLEGLCRELHDEWDYY